MLKVTDLIAALQQAAQQAAGAVAAEQVKLLSRFFQGGITDAALSGGESLTPVMVKMAFPRVTADGPAQHDVYVPLISLAPLSSLHLSEMDIEIALNVIDQGDDLLVGAAPRGPVLGEAEGSPTSASSRPGNLTIRMKFTATGQPEGTRLIIDGFARALRAQIPS
jgi:hypothetical protein